jgi:hypothetical protein
MIPRQPKPSSEEVPNEIEKRLDNTSAINNPSPSRLEAAGSETLRHREERYLKGPTAFSA